MWNISDYMNKSIIKISLCAGLLASCGVKEDENSEYVTKFNDMKIEDVQKFNFNNNYDSIIEEYERLKKEEEELERQRLAEIERKKQEEAKRLAEQKRIEEAKRIEREKAKSKEVDNSSEGWMTFNISYYGTDCYGCGNLTASGINVANTNYYKGYRIIAADTSILPMGTIVEIVTPNEKIVGIIADRGGAIKGYKLDVLVDSEDHAAKIGRHNGKLRVVGNMEIK